MVKCGFFLNKKKKTLTLTHDLCGCVCVSPWIRNLKQKNYIAPLNKKWNIKKKRKFYHKVKFNVKENCYYKVFLGNLKKIPQKYKRKFRFKIKIQKYASLSVSFIEEEKEK